MQQLHWSKARHAISLRQGPLEFKIGRTRSIAQICPNGEKKDRLGEKAISANLTSHQVLTRCRNDLDQWQQEAREQKEELAKQAEAVDKFCCRWVWCRYYLLKVTIRVIRESTNADLCFAPKRACWPRFWMKFKMHFTLLVRETLHQKASTGNMFLENLAVENWM